MWTPGAGTGVEGGSGLGGGLHPARTAPYIQGLGVGVAAAVLVLPGKLDLLAATYSLAATFAFCIAHLAVMRLRYVSPELYRPSQTPSTIPLARPSIQVPAGSGRPPRAANGILTAWTAS